MKRRDTIFDRLALKEKLFINQHNGKFVEKTKEFGLADIFHANVGTFADLDNDGDMDLVINNIDEHAHIYRNKATELSENHFLKVKFKGSKSNINGIGETQIKSLEKFFQNKTNIKVVEKLSEILSVKDREVKSKGKLKNISFMFTGKLQNISRAEAKSLIEENAGSIVSSVTKKLDYLVTGEKPTNRKVEQAKNLGIKILTQKEWSDLLN